MPDAPNIPIVAGGKTEAFMLRKLLERHGYRVSVTGDGRDALDVLGREPVHLVVSDIDMPGMDGYVLCDTIKSDARG
ncbi:MAG: response regulator [Verrucomicrobia bacterium]|nr:response regulator [Verrucomicrobiota bacterium]